MKDRSILVVPETQRSRKAQRHQSESVGRDVLMCNIAVTTTNHVCRHLRLSLSCKQSFPVAQHSLYPCAIHHTHVCQHSSLCRLPVTKAAQHSHSVTVISMLAGAVDRLYYSNEQRAAVYQTVANQHLVQSPRGHSYSYS